MLDRRQQATNLGKREIEAYDMGALARIVRVVTGRPDYASGKVFGPLAANDADPNTSAPTADRVLIGAPESGATVSAIAITPTWSTGQAVVLRVWAKTGLVAPAWTLVKSINLAGDGTDVEQVVDVGCRDVFVQVVSGVDAGHQITLAVAVM